MQKVDLLNNIGKIIVFLLVFFSFFLLTVKTQKKLPNRLFSIFLLLIAFDLSGLFLYEWFLKNLYLEILRISSSLLQMPLFYLYVLSVCYADFTLKSKHFLHILLFIAFYFIFLNIPVRGDGILLFEIAGEIQYAFYIIAILLALKKYKKIYLENYTNADTINYKWLLQMTLVFLTAHLFVVSKMILNLTQNKDAIILSNIVVSISALSVTSWIVLKALYQPQLFRGIEIKLEPVETILQEENKIHNIEINAEISQKIETLKNYMREKEPFLEPALTIQELASQIDLPQKELSVLINHHIGQHFFDFVNDYRIQKAMKILQDPTKTAFTVLEILYEVGFNSKSSFNTAFKKHTNQTPTEYRKHSLSTK